MMRATAMLKETLKMGLHSRALIGCRSATVSVTLIILLPGLNIYP